MSFSVFQTRLGSRLNSLKENSPLFFFRPIVVSQSTIIDATRVIQVLTCGILCDISSSSISITFPTATEIYSVLNCGVGDYISFYISPFSPTFPNANTVTLVGNTGVEIIDPTPLDSQVTYFATIVCISLNPLKFYII